MSWHLAVLGTATGTLAIGDVSILWIVRWSRFGLSTRFFSNRLRQLGGAILLLFDIRPNVVLVLVVAHFRETSKASNHFNRRDEIHWKITWLINSGRDAYDCDDAVELHSSVNASVCHCHCEFLSVVEFLYARQLPNAVPQNNVRHQLK